MTTTQSTHESDRQFVLEMIDKRPKNMPGLPVEHVPLMVAVAMRSLIADGTVRIVEVTKNKGMGDITYHYLVRS